MLTRQRTKSARRWALAPLAAALALALPAAGCGGDDSTPEDLKLVIEGEDQTVTLVDNPANRVAPPNSKLDDSKETPGDMAVQQAVVRNQAGERVGENFATFTTVGDPGTELATGTLQLQGGTLAFQGMIGEEDEDELAILGGTGEYAGARGILRVSQEGETVNLATEFAE